VRKPSMTPLEGIRPARKRLLDHIDALAYKFLVVPLQSERLHDFVPELFGGSAAVLDFGCGIGNNAVRFDPGCYTGVDISPGRIRQACRDHPDHVFRTIPEVGIQQPLPFADQRFDRVLISLCLHHIPPAICRAVLGEIRRVLRNDGLVAGLEPCRDPDRPFRNRYMDLMDGGRHIGDQPYYERLFDSAGLKVETHSRTRNFGFDIWRYTASIPGQGADHHHL